MSLPKTTPTLVDVAARAGVSKTTASVVLSGTDAKLAIAAATRARVLNAAAELDYHPNALARGLARKPMDTMGVVFAYSLPSPISSPYFGPILDGITGVGLREEQSTLLLSVRAWSKAYEKLPRYRDGRCDGLLLIAPPIGCGIVAAVQKTNLPFVVTSTHSRVEGVSSVDVDNVAGAQLLVAHLLERGHRRIGVLCEDGATADYAGLRLEGYQRALEVAGVGRDDALVRVGDSNQHSLSSRVHDLMRLPPARRPTALFCGRHQDARDMLPVLQAAGLRVPADISVVVFDDFPLDPPHRALTAVRQPLREVGERAAEMLLAQSREREAAGRKSLLVPDLVVRDSVGPPAA